MNKQHQAYVFAPGAANAGTITLTGLNVPLSQILVISDATEGTVIYNFADTSVGAFSYTQGADSVLTLKADTSSFSSGDSLTVLYDDGVPIATEATAASILAKIIAAPATEAKQDSIKTSVDAITTRLNSSLAVTGAFWQATQPISAASLPLPTGASTSAKQDDIKTSVDAVTTRLNSSLAVTGTFWQATQPVSASSLPLPSGASTSAKQDTIDTSINTLLKPASTLAAVTTLGSITNALPVGTNSIGQVTANAGTNLNTSALALEATLSAASAKLPASLGAKTGATSLSVVPNTDTVFPISAASLPLPSGAATSAKQDTIDTSINTLLKPASTLAAVTSLGSITNALPTGTNSIGQVTANAGTNLNTSLLALDSTVAKDASIGSLTETAPISDTASSAINGRLQRIAQRLTSLIGLFPTSLGIKTSANSFSVTPASDASFAVTGTFWQATQPVSGTVTVNAGTNLNTSLLATESTLGVISGKLPTALDGDRLKVILPSGGSGLTDTELRATPVPVSGSFSVTGGATSAQLETLNATQIQSLSTAATSTQITSLISAVGSPLQAGGSVGISGTPTVNLGTIGAAATSSQVATLNETQISALSAANTATTQLASATSQLVTLNAKDFATSAKQDISNGYLSTETSQLAVVTSQIATLNATQAASLAAAATSTQLTSLISAVGSPLQTGGAVIVSGVSTAANQTAEIALLQTTTSQLASLVSNIGLTDSQLRATPVPVSGSFSVTGGATSAQLDTLNTTQISALSTLTDKTQFTKITDGTDTLLINTDGSSNVTLTALSYPASTNNSSTAQLAAGATFTGVVETIQNLQAAQIQVICDQPYTLSILQYIDSGGTKLTSTDTFTRSAGQPFNENIQLPGNYFRLTLKNEGLATTTTLTIDTTFGIMDALPRAVTNSGNLRTAINEFGSSVSGEEPPNADTTYALFVRNIREDNAYTQMLLADIVNLLTKVFTMTAAGANPSLSVSQALGTNLNATVVQGTAASLLCTATLSGGGVAAATVPLPQTTVALPVTVIQQSPLPIIPLHIYNAIEI